MHLIKPYTHVPPPPPPPPPLTHTKHDTTNFMKVILGWLMFCLPQKKLMLSFLIFLFKL